MAKDGSSEAAERQATNIQLHKAEAFWYGRKMTKAVVADIPAPQHRRGEERILPSLRNASGVRWQLARKRVWLQTAAVTTTGSRGNSHETKTGQPVKEGFRKGLEPVPAQDPALILPSPPNTSMRHATEAKRASRFESVQVAHKLDANGPSPRRNSSGTTVRCKPASLLHTARFKGVAEHQAPGIVPRSAQRQRQRGEEHESSPRART